MKLEDMFFIECDNTKDLENILQIAGTMPDTIRCKGNLYFRINESKGRDIEIYAAYEKKLPTCATILSITNGRHRKDGMFSVSETIPENIIGSSVVIGIQL